MQWALVPLWWALVFMWWALVFMSKALVFMSKALVFVEYLSVLVRRRLSLLVLCRPLGGPGPSKMQMHTLPVPFTKQG
jgi:hypothetical protein